MSYIEYRDSYSRLHRLNGPAYISDTLIIWSWHGLYHREDGPAIIHSNGDMQWYLYGKLHRSDGPAVTKKYSQNGQLQYLVSLWYLHDKLLSETEYIQCMKYNIS